MTTKPQSTTEPPDRIWIERAKGEGYPRSTGFYAEPIEGGIEYTRISPASAAPVVDVHPANKLRPEHKCKPLARAVMMEGRDWWIGELLEPVPEWSHETHCLHMKTPLKDVSFLCNAGDFEQLLVLSNVVVQLENLLWLKAATAGAKVRLLPPFSAVCSECSGSGKTVIGCAVDSPLTAPCAKCAGTGQKLRTVANYEDKGTPDEEVFDRLIAERDQMPRRWCSVHNRKEFKYESLEHELRAPAAATAAPQLHWPFAAKHPNCAECAKGYEPPSARAISDYNERTTAAPVEQSEPQYVNINGERRQVIPCPDGREDCEVLHTAAAPPAAPQEEASLNCDEYRAGLRDGQAVGYMARDQEAAKERKRRAANPSGAVRDAAKEIAGLQKPDSYKRDAWDDYENAITAIIERHCLSTPAESVEREDLSSRATG